MRRIHSFSIDSEYAYTLNIDNDDSIAKSKYANHFNESELTCFEHHKSNGSLIKAFLMWLAQSLILPPSLYFFILFHIPCILFPYTYFKLWGYFIFIILVLIFENVIIYINFLVYDFGYDMFYTLLIPFSMMVLFRDSFVFVFELKTRWKKFEQMVLFNDEHRGCFVKCQMSVGWCCLEEIQNKDEYPLFGVTGVTFQDYIPFGKLTIYNPKRKIILMSNYLFETCMNKYDISNGWSLFISYDTYNQTEKVLLFIMGFLALCYVLIPWIWHIILNVNNSSFLYWSNHTVGLFEHSIIAYSIFSYTELIYFRLFKYYALMNQLADLLEINPIKKKNRFDMRFTYNKNKKNNHNAIISCVTEDNDNDNDNEEKKMEDESHKTIKINMDSLRKGSTTPLLSYNKSKQGNMNNDDGDNQGIIATLRIHLHLKENCQIWFENWCRIQNIASIYFENRKSHIFAIIICIAFGIAFVVIRILFSHKWFSPNIIAMYIGLLYFMIAFIRLLLSSVRFSDLQRRHIALLQNQHTFALYKIHDQYLKYIQSDPNKYKKYKVYEQTSYMNLSFIMDIINQIEFRSLSPKIAGVSLDSALVKLAASILVFLLTSAITYELRQS